MSFFKRMLATDAPAAVVLVRLLVGGVFLSEGVQKFVFPEALGVGRFRGIGIPAPEIMAPSVGVCETACGALRILALLTRGPAVPMLIDMIVSISTTRLPTYLRQGF